MHPAENKEKVFYKALLEKDSEYEGIFFVGVKTIRVFCRPTCPARKPKFENSEFYSTAQEVLLASFRPCKRCNPLSNPGRSSLQCFTPGTAEKAAISLTATVISSLMQ